MANPQTNYSRRKMPIRAIQWRHKLLRVERKLVAAVSYLKITDNCKLKEELKDELSTLEELYKELIDERST